MSSNSSSLPTKPSSNSSINDKLKTLPIPKSTPSNDSLKRTPAPVRVDLDSNLTSPVDKNRNADDIQTIAEKMDSPNAFETSSKYAPRTWMEKPVISVSDQLEGVSEGLEFLVPLARLYIYERIPMIDTIYYDKKKYASKNMLRIKNENYQEVYYVATSHDNKPGKFWGYKYRIIDQYARHIFSVTKFFTMPICGTLTAEIRCPPGKIFASIRQLREDNASVRYKITKPGGSINFEVLRKDSENSGATFDIMYGDKSVGRIAKRFERDKANKNLDSTYEGDFIRIDFPAGMKIFEKLVVLATALLINVAHFRN